MSLDQCGLLGDTLVQDLFEVAASPNPRLAGKAFHRLKNLAIRAVVHQAVQPQDAVIPTVNENQSVLIGYSESGQGFRLPDSQLNRHVLVAGDTGSGKTTLEFRVMVELVQRQPHTRVGVTMIDLKNEGRRLLASVPNAIVLRPSDLTTNLLEPIGESESYFAAVAAILRKSASLQEGTGNHLSEVLLALDRGRPDGTPMASWLDLARVLDRLGKSKSIQTYSTLARHVRSVSAFLGNAARVRKGPNPESSFDLTVFDLMSVPVGGVRFLNEFFLLRSQRMSQRTGHSVDTLRRVRFSDEAGLEFHRNLTAATNQVSVLDRMVTQVRSGGLGLWLGTQSLRNISDAVRTNAQTVVVFRLQGRSECIEACQLLRIDEERWQEIAGLPTGTAYIRSGSLIPNGIRIRTPMAEFGDVPSEAAHDRIIRPIIESLLRETVYAPTDRSHLESLHYEDAPSDENTTSSDFHPSETNPKERFFADWIEFLKEVAEHPERNVTEHYRRLGKSTGTLHRTRATLENEGLIRSEQTATRKPGRRRVYLKVTAMGLEMIATARRQ